VHRVAWERRPFDPRDLGDHVLFAAQRHFDHLVIYRGDGLPALIPPPGAWTTAAARVAARATRAA
jgi:hypothetical protein